VKFVLLFVFGFVCGLCFLSWRRSRSDAQIKYLLRDLKPDAPDSPMSSSSQLSLAIARQQKIHHALEQSIEAYRHALNDAPIGVLRLSIVLACLVCC
jgi:two-component system, OmpR family, phosphate regulon sensor histidine kinase PhoR